MSIVILHGALGSSHQFQRFAQHGMIVEFFGHGTTADVDEPWTMDLFAHQLESLLTSTPVLRSPVSVFGYSMGGYVALMVAQRRPDLIGRILTLGTKLAWSTEQAQNEVKMLNADVIEQKVPAFAADLQHRHGTDRWRTVLAKTADLMIDLGNDPRLTPSRMNEISIPVRYMVGDRDEMVTLEETVHFHRATPGSELAVLPGTRHPIEKVRQEIIDRHVEEFL